jgi:hypothetical protein
MRLRAKQRQRRFQAPFGARGEIFVVNDDLGTKPSISAAELDAIEIYLGEALSQLFQDTEQASLPALTSAYLLPSDDAA